MSRTVTLTKPHDPVHETSLEYGAKAARAFLEENDLMTSEEDFKIIAPALDQETMNKTIKKIMDAPATFGQLVATRSVIELTSFKTQIALMQNEIDEKSDMVDDLSRKNNALKQEMLRYHDDKYMRDFLEDSESRLRSRPQAGSDRQASASKRTEIYRRQMKRYTSTMR